MIRFYPSQDYVANDFQRSMLENFVKSFKTGILDHHRKGSIDWVRDKNPAVETYIGFIETPR